MSEMTNFLRAINFRPPSAAAIFLGTAYSDHRFPRSKNSVLCPPPKPQSILKGARLIRVRPQPLQISLCAMRHKGRLADRDRPPMEASMPKSPNGQAVA